MPTPTPHCARPPADTAAASTACMRRSDVMPVSSPKLPARAASQSQATPTSWRYSLRFTLGALSSEPTARRPGLVIRAACGAPAKICRCRTSPASSSRFRRRTAVRSLTPRSAATWGTIRIRCSASGPSTERSAAVNEKSVAGVMINRGIGGPRLTPPARAFVRTVRQIRVVRDLVAQMAEELITDEQEAREAALVAAVVDSFEHTPDGRTRAVLESLVRHLHAFLRETRLTEEE